MYSNIATFINKRFHIDAHYFLKGGFWLSVGQTINIALGLFSTALFAHYLSENSYGTYKYLLGLAVLLSSFSLTGLNLAIIQATAKKYATFYNATLSINFLYNLAVGITALIGAGYYFFHQNHLLAIGCLIIALFQPLINTFQNTSFVLQGNQQFRAATISQIIRLSFVTAVTTGTILVTQDVLLLFTSYLLSSTLANIFFHFIHRPRKQHLSEDVFQKYLSYAKHTSFRNLISNVAHRADTVLVFTQLGAAELAIYSIATVIPEQLKASIKNLSALLLPKYAKYDDLKSLRYTLKQRSVQLFIILFVCTMLYILFSPFLYKTIFPKYNEAILYSQIAALAFPSLILLIPYSILQARMSEKELHKITLYSSLFQIISLFLLIGAFGLLGAIISRILYRMFLLISCYYYIFQLR